MSEYVDDVPMVMSEISEIQIVDTALKKWEEPKRAIVNKERSVGMQLRIWRGRPMPTRCGGALNRRTRYVAWFVVRSGFLNGEELG